MRHRLPTFDWQHEETTKPATGIGALVVKVAGVGRIFSATNWITVAYFTRLCKKVFTRQALSIHAYEIALYSYQVIYSLRIAWP